VRELWLMLHIFIREVLAMRSGVLAKIVVIFSSVVNNFSNSVWLMISFCHSNRDETFFRIFFRKTWNNSGGLYINGRIGLIFAINILIIIILKIIMSLQFQGIPI